jgi:hypothetical protein
MRTRRPAHPARQPIIPIAQRLEHVRAHMGFPSIRSFWQALREGWPDAPSYEAVGGYHYNREAPAGYLARVADFSGFTLEWLINGREPMQDGEIQVGSLGAYEEELCAFFEPLPSLRPAVSSHVLELMLLVCISSTAHLTTEEEAEPLPHTADELNWKIAAARRLGAAVAAPLAALGIDPAEWDDSARRHYLMTFTPSLVSVVVSTEQRKRAMAYLAGAFEGYDEK